MAYVSIIKRALKVYNFIPFCINLYTFNARYNISPNNYFCKML